MGSSLSLGERGAVWCVSRRMPHTVQYLSDDYAAFRPIPGYESQPMNTLPQQMRSSAKRGNNTYPCLKIATLLLSPTITWTSRPISSVVRTLPPLICGRHASIGGFPLPHAQGHREAPCCLGTVRCRRLSPPNSTVWVCIKFVLS